MVVVIHVVSVRERGVQSREGGDEGDGRIKLHELRNCPEKFDVGDKITLAFILLHANVFHAAAVSDGQRVIVVVAANHEGTIGGVAQRRAGLVPGHHGVPGKTGDVGDGGGRAATSGARRVAVIRRMRWTHGNIAAAAPSTTGSAPGRILVRYIFSDVVAIHALPRFHVVGVFSAMRRFLTHGRSVDAFGWENPHDVRHLDAAAAPPEGVRVVENLELFFGVESEHAMLRAGRGRGSVVGGSGAIDVSDTAIGGTVGSAVNILRKGGAEGRGRNEDLTTTTTYAQ